MAEQELNGTHVGAGFQQMDREGVTQGVLVLLMIRQPRSITAFMLSMVQKSRLSVICGEQTLQF